MELTEISLYLPQLPEYLEGLRILQVGDLHTHGYQRKERSLRKVIEQGGDILAFTGDFCWQGQISNPFSPSQRPYQVGITKHGLVLAPKWKQALAVCRRLMESVHFSLGTYAVQGNHDSDDLLSHLQNQGVVPLRNETRQVATKGGETFNICGLNCASRSNLDLPKTVLGIEPDRFTIGMCHYPEMAEPLAQAGVDLILAGHTHGGQICLPNGKPLTTHSQTGRMYASSLARIGRSVIYTTRGLSAVLPIRINCPPEIARLTLRRGKPESTRSHIINMV